MGLSGAYFDLLEWLDRQETLDPGDFLSRLQSAYRTGRITYLSGMVPSARVRPHNTWGSQRHSPHHLARSLNRKAAFEQISGLLSALEPIELLSWQRTANSNLRIVGYPLPGRQSCLLVELTATAEYLSAWRRTHDRDMLSLGTLLTARLARALSDPHQERARARPLTRRERETLAWIAAGKSYWETAVILGISERTIRHFMANARQKLDVVNNAQAVAEAVWRGLIPRLVEAEVP
ncbi:LuxR family transcriptional regulator, quorum-sensing system regulator SinR [Rhizobium sp. RU33A]|uniref:helix-turn-helix transcriptional regulator n=1 Tax=Rhizobium sp. RU33A TaxID=1907413 RepID=UPI0009548B67|nr:helix-turn-helix domain-containing protein [Rhizobium sp. RU33A]SIQ96522.1 LuxR family transcriptional regulator, quorum-sensing system regulator SinR [Rhizobium sp. RU33A]